MANLENINYEFMLKAGTILHGIYRIDGYMSSGGFGNTYLATHMMSGSPYAIKEFFMKGVTQRTGNSSMVSVSNSENADEFTHQLVKFKKEAQRLNKLNNKNIVKVHDLFEENGTAYYVMDFIDGEDLRHWLKRMKRPMTEHEVMTILPQVLNALEDVHSKGIWHLDLKPANIMIDRDWTVKLIDFGASKQFDSNRGGVTSSAIAYTSGFAPLEQMERSYDKFGPWTDFYALGATLYNLLTNKRPPMPSDINDDHSIDKQIALPMPDAVSGNLRTLVLWLMTPARDLRPHDISAIRNFLSASPVDSSSTSTIDKETQILSNKHIIGQSPFPTDIKSNQTGKKSQQIVVNPRPNPIAIFFLSASIILLLGCLGYLFYKSPTTSVKPNDLVKASITQKNTNRDDQPELYTSSATDKERYDSNSIVGTWFQPHYAPHHLNFYRDGDVIYHISDDKTVRGKYTLKNNRLTIDLNNGTHLIFKYGNPWNDGRPEKYIYEGNPAKNSGDLYFVKGETKD